MEWIKPENQLPIEPESFTKRKRYLVLTEYGIDGAWYIGCKRWQDDDGERVTVLMWMPLPLPPKD